MFSVQFPYSLFRDTNEGSSSSSRDGNGSDESNIQLLEDKVAMLSKALNTVTEGKANMEAAFKNDRKSIIVSILCLDNFSI